MLKTMAQRVHAVEKNTAKSNSTYQEEVVFDPASIMLYISIISAVIKLVKQCREAKSVPTSAQQPSRFEKAVVTRIVKRKLGFYQYLRHGRKLVQSIFDVGAKSTTSEIQELYDDIS